MGRENWGHLGHFNALTFDSSWAGYPRRHQKIRRQKIVVGLWYELDVTEEFNMESAESIVTRIDRFELTGAFQQ